MTPTFPSTARRRELSRAARDAFPPMGVYALRNAAQGTVRVRASRNVHGAINRDHFALRLGSHPDHALQEEWSRDPASFTFEVLALVKVREEPDFDYAAELRVLEELYRAEFGCEGNRMSTDA